MAADTLDNNYLVIDIDPTRSNLDGIGLKVELTTDSGKKLIRQITGGSSFHSHDDNLIFFGLGDETAEEIKFFWPHTDTPVQTITDITSNVMVIQEP